MKEAAPTLKWGDIIRIHGVNLSKKEEDNSRGLIVTKGFTDPNIYYQKYKQFQDVNLYRQSLFQICPRISFDVHDQLQQAQSSVRQMNKGRLQAEAQNLQKLLDTRAQTPVKYGSEVIFKHVQSQSYLRGVLKAADIGQGAFKIDVTDSMSSKIIFKLTSHRSYERDKDVIYYDDALQIYHPGADCFMNFAQKDEAIYLDTNFDLEPVPQHHEFQKYKKNRPAIKKPNHTRIPIINQNKAKCYWKFIEHCSYVQYNSKSKIKSHDIVYFEHTKQNGLVSSTLSQPMIYYLKQSYGLYYDCFWQLIPKEVNQLGPQQCNSFWARNIVTGRLLTYEDFPVQIVKEGDQGLSAGFDNQGLVNLVCSEAKQEQVALKLERGQQFCIEQDVPEIIKEFQQLFCKINFTAVPKMPKDIFKIYKVDEKTLLDIQFALSSHEPLVKLIEILSSGLKDQYQHNFRFQNLVDSQILKEDVLNNVINILKMLIGKIYHTNYQNILTSGSLPDQNIQKILVQAGIVQLVIELLALIYQPFKIFQAGTMKDKQSDNCLRIRLRLSDIFQFSYRLLEKTAAYNQKNRTYISRYVDLFLLHSNTINRSYIQQCLVGILQNNPVSIEATINRSKINQQIKSFFTEARNQTPDTFLTTKYLKLFETFIICEDRVIRQNQNIILEDFFKNRENQFSFRFKLEQKPQSEDLEQKGDDFISKIKSKQVRIAFGKQQFTSIRKFFRDWTSKWNYFIAYVNLLADICSNRNSVAIQNVSVLLSLQNVTVILFDPELQQLNKEIYEENKKNLQQKGELKFPIANVHEPFIRIAHHLYIDNDKFNPVKRIKKISRWYAHEGEQGPIIEQINRTKRVFQGQKEEQQQKYLKCILAFMKNYLQSCDQNQHKLSMLYTVLNVLKKTVTLGLWNKSDQFRQIIALLMMRVIKIQPHFFFDADNQTKNRSTLDQIVKNNKGLLSHNRPQITKAINCKTKALQIFQQINQYQIDIRLRYLMNFFKGLYQTTQDFNIYEEVQNIIAEVKYQSKQSIERNQRAQKEYNSVKQSNILGNDIKKVSEDQQIIFKQNVWYNKLKEVTPFNFNKDNYKDPIKNRYQFHGGLLKQISSMKSSLQVAELVDKHFRYLVMSLLELPVYRNNKLLNSSIKTLRTIFDQRTDLIENFKKILICGKGNLQQVYFTLKFMRSKFETLNDQNILKYEGNQDTHFSYALWKPYNYLQKIQQKRSGIIQDLWFLSKTLIENISLKNIQSLFSVDESAFVTDSIYCYIDQRQKTNTLFQAVNLAQGIYKPLISYITIVGDNVIKGIHFNLLCSIYQYLSLLCYNNLEAKQLLRIQIPKILPHLGKRVGAEHFLYVVAQNNKLLVSDQELVTLIINSCLNACIRLDHQAMLGNLLLRQVGDKNQNNGYEYQKSKIFYALKSILVFHEQGHRKNQQMLMDKLQDSKYRGLIIKDKDIDYKFQKPIDFDLSPTEAFVTAHFQMFSSLIQSGNFINIGKLQNIHSYPYCLQCMKNTTRWQIRRALRCYVNRLYYVNKDKDIFLFQEFIRKEFDIINTQLFDLVELHKSKLLTLDVKIKNSIRFKYGISEIMVFLIEILISLHEILLKSEFMKVLRRELSKQQKYADSNRILHQKIVRLYKNLGCLNRLYPETKIIGPFLTQVSSLVNKVLMTFQVKYLEKKQEPEAVEHQKQDTVQIGGEVEKKNYVYDHSKSFFRNLNDMIRDYKAKQKMDRLRQLHQNKKNTGKLSEDTIKSRCLQTIYSVPSEKLKAVYTKRKQRTPAYHNPHLQTTTSRTFKVLAKPEISENQQNVRLNERLNTVKMMIDQSPAFKKFKDDEFYKLISIISQNDETSSEYYHENWAEQKQAPRPAISIKQCITTIFNMVINDPSCLPDKEKIFIIKLVRCFITQGIQSEQQYKLPVDKWDSDYSASSKQQQKLIERQNLLKNCGCSQFIISILSEDYSKEFSKKLELLNQILLLGISYLFGGNTQCQDSLLSTLRGDEDNIMLLSMRKIIKRLGQFLIEVRAIKQGQKQRNYALNIVDTYDFFSMKDHAICKEFGLAALDKFQIETETAHENAMCRIFRLLQLFCQNNNENFKKFLQTQINESGQKKTNSVNFIEEASLLLRKFFKIMNNKVVGIPNNLLAFIGEITQLPCLDNQISFMKSTFFQDISYLATFFEDDANRKQRMFNANQGQENQPLQQLMDIYEQGIGLALSNLQGNDPILFSQFLNKCHPKYLWLVMRQNLYNLLKQDRHSILIQNQAENQKENMRMALERLNQEQIDKLIKRQQAHDRIFDGPLVGILNVVIIMRKINDYDEWMHKQAEQDINPDSKGESQKAKQFKVNLIDIASEYYEHFGTFLQKFEQLLIQIQISSFNGKQQNLQNLYFPFHPVFHYLSPSTKDQIMMNVIRNTRRDKLVSISRFYKTIVAQIQWGYELNKNTFDIGIYKKQMPITSDFCDQIRGYARNCSYMIIALLVVFIAIDHDTTNEEISSHYMFPNLISMFIIKGLCYIQLGLTLFYVYLWSKMRARLSIQKYHKIGDQQVIADQQEYQEAEVQVPKQGWMTISHYLSVSYGLIKRIFSKISGFLKDNWIYKGILEPILALISTEGQLKSLLVFVIASFLGTFYSVEYFTIHLFDMFTTIPLLTNVFKAVINNISTLTILSMLATAFVLVFNILSLSTYTPVIYGEDIPEESCEDILDCVLVVYTAGAIGDDMDELVIGRFIFDIVFVVFMEMLFGNLISGVMLDSFGELKQQDKQRDEDKQGFCYICGMSREDVEKSKQNFDDQIPKTHVKRHNLWNYMFYIFQLLKKDSTDYTGVEYYIYKMLKIDEEGNVQCEQINWFPDLGGQDDEGEVQNKFQQLKQKVESIQNSVSQTYEQSLSQLDTCIQNIRPAIPAE